MSLTRLTQNHFVSMESISEVIFGVAYGEPCLTIRYRNSHLPEMFIRGGDAEEGMKIIRSIYSNGEAQ